jgi:hypothetical protein
MQRELWRRLRRSKEGCHEGWRRQRNDGDQEKTNDKFRQRAAIVIAILAMILAITSLGGSNAGKEAVNNNVLAPNYWNFFQAKNMRQTAIALAADQFELAFLNDPALPEDAKAALKRRLSQDGGAL